MTRWNRVQVWRLALAILLLFGAAFALTSTDASPSAVLFGEASSAAPLPFSLACTQKGCAAFTLEQDAGCRVRAVRLNDEGAPLEDTRRDFGRTTCRYLVTSAGDDYVLALYAPTPSGWWKLLLVDGSDLSVVRELPGDALSASTLSLHSDGTTVIGLDWNWDDVVVSIDLATGEVIAKAAILDFWQPVVIPGAGQYLFFYPNHGYYVRLSAQTGQFLGPEQLVAPNAPGAFEASGYFRDGVFQLVWRYDVSSGIGNASLYGVRVDALTGKVLETDALGEPAPQLLCKDCPILMKGAFHLGASTYLWFASFNDQQSLLELDPATGQRRNGALIGPDVTFPGTPIVSQVEPPSDPKLAAADGAVFEFDAQHLSQPLSGSGHLPGKSNGVKPGAIKLASNGESYLAAWYAKDELHAAQVRPEIAPALAIESVQSLSAEFPELLDFDVASAGGDFLLLGARADDEQRLFLMWRTVSASGQVGGLVSEPTGHVLTGADDVMVALGSDGEHYLAALFVGSIATSTGTIQAQRRDAGGGAIDTLASYASGVAILDGVFASFAEPAADRLFGIAYRRRSTFGFRNELRLLPASSGTEGDTFLLEDARALANDGKHLLLSNGQLFGWRDEGKLTPLNAPTDLLEGVSHWDGNAYVKLSGGGEATLIASAFSDRDSSAAGTARTLTQEQVGYGPVAVGDGKGRSLIAYFAAEAPEHAVQLRGALFETTVSEAGAGGDGGHGGESQPLGQAGQGTQAEGGAAGGGGSLHGAAAEPPIMVAGEGGEDSAPPRGPRLSSGCGCQVPGANVSAPGGLLAAWLLVGARLIAARRRLGRRS